jgi:23S rRNA (cytosine1962-C5)-methyltransferase
LYPSVTVNRKAEDRVESGHPWIYSSDVTDRGQASPGSPVRVLGPRGKPLGTAHYSSTSQITLRLLSRRVETLDRAFYLERLQTALAHRRRIVRESDAYRLVHAEGDLLPALIVDVYGEYVVAQFLDQGMEAAKPEILSCLQELLQPRGVLARNDAAVRRLEDLPLENAVLAGEIPEAVEIRMNGLVWQARLHTGQKTGIYLDQRENYLAARRFARGRALDCFTSTGGFALHLAGVCESVEAIDSGEAVLETARANALANSLENITFREADVFHYLAGVQRKWDTIVLDPPAFAKNRASLEGALRGYKEIQVRALRLLSPGGTLITCSCSHHVSEADLLQVVAEAALDTRRTLRVLERRAQASDHPVILTTPETLYLKCLFFEAL